MFQEFLASGRIPASLDMYVVPTEATNEIARRHQASATLQYIPLFLQSWRRAYPFLATIFPALMDGNTALHLLKVFAATIGRPDDASHACTLALLEIAKEQWPAIDNAQWRGCEPLEIVHKLARLHQESSLKPHDGGHSSSAAT